MERPDDELNLTDTGNLAELFGEDDDDSDDPIKHVKYTGREDVDAKAELTALQQAWEDKKAKAKEAYANAFDSGFWFAVCFLNREQKDAFLTALGINLEETDSQYLDGIDLAERLKIDLPGDAYPKLRSSDRRLVEALGLVSQPPVRKPPPPKRG